MPTVSIITPAYNAEQYIGETAKSVLEQDFSDWEWIIVDDGSTDNTAAQISAIKDARIILVSQRNKGVSAARNAALDLAKGTYITFLDADDRLPRQSLSCRVSFLDDNQDIGILNGRVKKFTANGDVTFYHPSPTQCTFFPHIAQLQEPFFGGTFYMVRQSCIGSHRFPAGISHCEDLIFFTELAHAHKMIYAAVEDCIYEYRLRPNSAMSNLSGIERGYYEFLRRTLPMVGMTPDMRRYLRFRISSILAKSWLRQGRPIHALSSAARAFLV